MSARGALLSFGAFLLSSFVALIAIVNEEIDSVISQGSDDSGFEKRKSHTREACLNVQ